MFSFFKQKLSKLRSSLSKTSMRLTNRLFGLFSKSISEDTLDEIEEVLYEADLGSYVIEELIEVIKKYHYSHKNAEAKDYMKALKEHSKKWVQSYPFELGSEDIFLVIGSNGSGKTTTIAKLAKLYKDANQQVLLVAADTFRAAAANQLDEWSNRIGVDIVKSHAGADPASVVYDGLTKAKQKGYTATFVDTAGRLESKIELFNELKKIQDVIKQKTDTAKVRTLAIIDATIGQTAMNQIETFHKHTPVDAIIITKLDSSAKGGIVLPIYHTLKIPVAFIGLGESSDDLEPFDPDEYLDALFSYE